MRRVLHKFINYKTDADNMKRKIIQVAESTYVVSLPKHWVQEHDLSKGDEINVKVSDNTLEIRAENGKPFELDVDVSALTPFLADRFMARAYQKGYDVIKLHFDHPDILQAVRRKVPELKGFEVTKITHNSCVIQSITTTDLDFKTSLKRAFDTVAEMSAMCKEGYETEDKNLLKTIEFRDLNVNKFCYFALRCLNKKQHDVGLGQSMLYYHVERLEDLGDEFKFLSRALLDVKPGEKIVLKLLELTQKLLQITIKFFYEPSREGAVDTIKIYKEIKNTIDKNLSKDEAVLRTYFVFQTISRILYHYPTMRLDTIAKIS